MKIIMQISLALFTSYLTATDQLLETIKYHTKMPVKIYQDSDAVSNMGYMECNFLQNGENLVVKNFIKKSDLVIDAGAHVGSWSKSVLQSTGSECLIYAFEPVPNSYIALNLLKMIYKDKINIFNLALGKEDTTLEMNYFFERGSDCSTLFNRPVLDDVPVKKIQVSVTYLDKFAKEFNISHINFLKIDTEGCEWDVLLGAGNLIKNNQIDVIQFEYGGTYTDAGITLHQVYNYLESNDFLIFRIVADGLIYIPTWNDSLENYKYSNYLALKKVIF